MFWKKKNNEPAPRVMVKTQLITGVHAAHTGWRLLRWLLFLAALLSVVCGGFLLSLKSSEVQCQYQTLTIEPDDAKKFVEEHGSSIASKAASMFRSYWSLLVLMLAGVFTFFELFIHSRWKIYLIYALIAVAAWVFVLYSFNLLEIPEEIVKKAGAGG